MFEELTRKSESPVILLGAGALPPIGARSSNTARRRNRPSARSDRSAGAPRPNARPAAALLTMSSSESSPAYQAPFLNVKRTGIPFCLIMTCFVANKVKPLICM